MIIMSTWDLELKSFPAMAVERHGVKRLVVSASIGPLQFLYTIVYGKIFSVSMIHE